MEVGDTVTLQSEHVVVADYDVETNTIILLGMGDDCIVFPARAKPFHLSPKEIYTNPNMQTRSDGSGNEYEYKRVKNGVTLLYTISIPNTFKEDGIYYLVPINHPGEPLTRRRDAMKTPPKDEILRWTAKTIHADQLKSTLTRLYTKNQGTIVYYNTTQPELINSMTAVLVTEDGALWWCPVKLLKTF